MDSGNDVEMVDWLGGVSGLLYPKLKAVCFLRSVLPMLSSFFGLGVGFSNLGVLLPFPFHLVFASWVTALSAHRVVHCILLRDDTV